MIIIVHQYNDFSGSPRVLKSVVDVLRSFNIEYRLYIGGGENGYFNADEFTNYNYRRTKSKIYNIFSYFISQFKLFRILLIYRNDDVKLYLNTVLPFGAAIFGIIFRKKFIYHIHEVSIRPKFLLSFLNYFVRKASQVLVVSDYVSGFYNDINSKVLLLPNCVSSELELSAAEHNYLNGFNCKTITMIASLRAYKGINEFFDIANYFNDDNSIKFLLVLNTSFDEYNLFFKDKLLSDNVNIMCNVIAIDEVYKQTTLLLNLSDSDLWIETFGLTLLEGMTFGVPVIAPCVGGHLDFIESGESGFLIDSKDFNSLVEKVDYLMKNPDVCFNFSRNAKLKASKYSYEMFKSNFIKNLL